MWNHLLSVFSAERCYNLLAALGWLLVLDVWIRREVRDNRFRRRFPVGGMVFDEQLIALGFFRSRDDLDQLLMARDLDAVWVGRAYATDGSALRARLAKSLPGQHLHPRHVIRTDKGRPS
jgi:hypothetical protein